MSDVALRRQNSHIHLFERYSTSYWSIICSVTNSITAESSVRQESDTFSGEEEKDVMYVAPLVSRHIDFLESLSESGTLGVDPHILRAALTKVVLLLGSAPVGPKTIERLQKYAGSVPVVRFGSTETTLQVGRRGI